MEPVSYFTPAEILQGLIGVTGWGMLIAAHRKHGIETIWWVAVIMTAGFAGYPAYFSSKKKFLEKAGAGKIELSEANRLTACSLVYFLVMIAGTIIIKLTQAISRVAFGRIASPNDTFLYKDYFWISLATTVLFIMAILIITSSSARRRTGSRDQF